MEDQINHKNLKIDKNDYSKDNLMTQRLLNRLRVEKVKRKISSSPEKVKKRYATSFSAKKPVPPGYKTVKPLTRYIN